MCSFYYSLQIFRVDVFFYYFYTIEKQPLERCLLLNVLGFWQQIEQILKQGCQLLFFKSVDVTVWLTIDCPNINRLVFCVQLENNNFLQLQMLLKSFRLRTKVKFLFWHLNDAWNVIVTAGRHRAMLGEITASWESRDWLLGLLATEKIPPPTEVENIVFIIRAV